MVLDNKVLDALRGSGATPWFSYKKETAGQLEKIEMTPEQLLKFLELYKSGEPLEGTKCSPTLTECPRCRNDIFKCDGEFQQIKDKINET